MEPTDEDMLNTLEYFFTVEIPLNLRNSLNLFFNSPKEEYKFPRPVKIIQNGPAFIVFWDDRTKTVIKKAEFDEDDIYAAFGQALAIKLYGTNSYVHKMVNDIYEDHTRFKYPLSDKERWENEILDKLKSQITGLFSDNKFDQRRYYSIFTQGGSEP